MPDRAGRFAGPRSFLTTALRGRYYDDSILQIRNLRLREAKQLSSRGKNVLIVPVYFPPRPVLFPSRLLSLEGTFPAKHKMSQSLWKGWV